MSGTLTIQQVGVGRPTFLGIRHGREIYSSICKVPVHERAIYLTHTGLAGDQQTDTRPLGDGRQVHGGRDKAVYLYPWEHLRHWAALVGRSVYPTEFGENLTTRGMSEQDVCIGDQFSWGEALLEVTKPRRPCFKLGMRFENPRVAAERVRNGRCGWYFSVLRPGLVPTRGELVRTLMASDAPTVAEAFAAKMLVDPTIPDVV